MDTIEIKLIFERRKTIEELEKIKIFFNNIVSPYEYTYCDAKEILSDKELLIKISYPRFFKGVNAFLISKSSECLEVQEHLSQMILDRFMDEDIEIQLTRVDIPFTYKMEYGRSFKSYENIFRIFAYIFSKKYPNSSQKGIVDLKTNEKETVEYTDTKCRSAYNHKLMIYNQYENIFRKTSKEEDFERIVEEFPDLSYRMRLEVSKRIDRKTFSLQRFKNFDILKEYFYQYKKYIFDNFLNFSEIDNFYIERVVKLAPKIQEAREKYKGAFNYKIFILENQDDIFDYNILKRVLKATMYNKKTIESAITITGKIMDAFEIAKCMIIKDTYKYLKDMKIQIDSMDINE